jgi:GNAT superfamily N-acetyltransferase
VLIRELRPGDAPACDALVAGLPDWFGDPTGIRDCASAVRWQPGLVAIDDDVVGGFLTWIRDASAAEITWMAVRADRRRSGIGRVLLDALVGQLRDAGVAELRVKTLSSRHADLGYAETRAFYRALGFEPVAELDVWGPENPAVLLRRRL